MLQKSAIFPMLSLSHCMLTLQTEHKKTLYYLEQLILKHGAHENTSNIKVTDGGLDFFYSARQDARKLTEFLQQVVPCR